MTKISFHVKTSKLLRNVFLAETSYCQRVSRANLSEADEAELMREVLFGRKITLD